MIKKQENDTIEKRILKSNLNDDDKIKLIQLLKSNDKVIINYPWYPYYTPYYVTETQPKWVDDHTTITCGDTADTIYSLTTGSTSQSNATYQVLI